MLQAQPRCPTYPVKRVQVQVLHLSVVKEACKADPVVGNVRLLANDEDIVLAGAGVEFQQLLSKGQLLEATSHEPTSLVDLHEGDAHHSQAHHNNRLAMPSGSGHLDGGGLAVQGQVRAAE